MTNQIILSVKAGKVQRSQVHEVPDDWVGRLTSLYEIIEVSAKDFDEAIRPGLYIGSEVDVPVHGRGADAIVRAYSPRSSPASAGPDDLSLYPPNV